MVMRVVGDSVKCCYDWDGRGIELRKVIEEIWVPVFVPLLSVLNQDV